MFLEEKLKEKKDKGRETNVPGLAMDALEEATSGITRNNSESKLVACFLAWRSGLYG